MLNINDSIVPFFFLYLTTNILHSLLIDIVGNLLRHIKGENQ